MTNNTGMYMMTQQSGKTRVNKVKEGKKNKRGKPSDKLQTPKWTQQKFSTKRKKRNNNKTDKPTKESTEQPTQETQLLDKKLASYQNVLNLQKILLQEGMTVSEYKKYVQDKINNRKHNYVYLSKEDIENLYSNYGKMYQKTLNQKNLVEENRKVKRKQRKNFRKQRSDKVNDYKEELIQCLFKELDKIPSGRGIVKTTHLSSDPKQWKETSNLLFTGGQYLLDSDKRWTSIYAKLSPTNCSALFDVVYGSDELKKSYLKV